ncbi:MAG: UbiX family flavin prenyltransferase [Oscillospiraceae bacterium]|nr:UbiX family flavin prenyltransferase [Oscillospiraceae bacterium]
MRIVVGITGGSGSIYALALLQLLGQLDVERHLVVSEMGLRVMEHECGVKGLELQRMGEVWHDNKNLGATIASGSFRFDAMAVAPCSMRTLAAIATGNSDSLLTRAADVCMKERRRLVLLAREMPLSSIHLENMLRLSREGVVIMPASPGFYNHPRDLSDLVGHVAGKMLDQLGVEHESYSRWKGEFR